MAIATAPSAPVIEVRFPIRGKYVVADHGFALYSAIARLLPSVHANQDMTILPLQGLPSGDRVLWLSEDARLRMRLPADQLPAVLPLAGKTLLVDGARLLLGVPAMALLAVEPSLWSRLVLIKGFTEPEPFEAAARRQLADLGTTGVLSLQRVRSTTALERRSARGVGEPIRRTLGIHGKQIVGFAVRVDELSSADSLTLQSRGLGGRRRFGCGAFVQAIPQGKLS
jgi:CRISPR-associated protein Cas6